MEKQIDKMEEFKYDVAFSFLYQDEAIVVALNDLVCDRLSTFVFSKQQEELAGTDGQDKFTEVFCKQSRIVVVLYRDGWGKTPFTKIEEIAIKNRVFGGDWEFFVVINLDKNSTLPGWIPRTHVWLDFESFGMEGAVGVIQYKVKQNGGEIRIETVQDKVAKMKRQRKTENERTEFLKAQGTISIAQSEAENLINKFKSYKEIIEDPSTFLHLGFQSAANMYELRYKGFSLRIANTAPFEYDPYAEIIGPSGILRVELLESSGTHPFDYQESIIEGLKLRFDQDLMKRNGWSDHGTGENFITSDELLDVWVKKFIDGIDERRNNQ